MLVRSSHRYAFRPGEWAEIISKGHRVSDGRPTLTVVFSDGVVDCWVEDDELANYEYKEN